MKNYRMRVLWLCNIVLPELCEEFGFKKGRFGGWLTGMWEEVKKCPDLTLAICVPIINVDLMKDGSLDGYQYYSFHRSPEKDLLGREKQEERFAEILKEFRPEVVHIWGTEYIHSYTMVQACKRMNMQNRVLVNIQGLVSVYQLHYDKGLTDEVLAWKEDGRSIRDEIHEFRDRGEYEKALLQEVCHVVGRTQWDKGCVLNINPDANYHVCGEILRPGFYKGLHWDADHCERYSIFISQATYPIKGFHLILRVLKQLLEWYPALHVYVAGTDVWTSNTSYARYIRSELEEKKLKDAVIFLGMIDEEKMTERYLRANVFLSPSAIENSSNSICEALRIGVPVVSSYVGGVTSLIEHEKSGFLYPLDEDYMALHYIRNIFENRELAEKISRQEIQRGDILNNKDEITRKMLSIYQIVGQS